MAVSLKGPSEGPFPSRPERILHSVPVWQIQPLPRARTPELSSNRWDRSLGLRGGLQRKVQSFTRLQTTCAWQVIGSVAGRRRSPPLCLAAVFVLVVEDTLASSSIPSARAGKRADAG